MANQETQPGRRPDVDGGAGDDPDDSVSAAAEEFEFRILSSGSLIPVGTDAADMCAADEVFSHGMLLPLRPLSAAAADDTSSLLMPRSQSMERAATSSCSTTGFSSWSDSRSASASSSSSSSGCVSRSHSTKSASSDHGVAPQRRPLPSSPFYAHPSPSPQLRSRPRRSTGSAAPAAWGVIRLGVVGAPNLYSPHAAEAKDATAARVGSRGARFGQVRIPKEGAVQKSLGFGLLGGGLGCKCSPDAVEPLSSPAAAAASRRRKK